MTFLEALIATSLILLCIYYKYMNKEFQHVVSKYISRIVITIPIGCYLATRFNLFTKDAQTFLGNFFPESIGILFTFFIIETFHNASKNTEKHKKAYLGLLAHTNTVIAHAEKFCNAQFLIFDRMDRRNQSNEFDLNMINDDVMKKLGYIARANVNQFKGYYLDPAPVESFIQSGQAVLTIEESYNELQKQILNISSSIDYNLHASIYTPLVNILASNTVSPLNDINSNMQLRAQNTGERIVTSSLDRDYTEPSNFSTPIIRMALRNKELSMNLISALLEIKQFLTDYEERNDQKSPA